MKEPIDKVDQEFLDQMKDVKPLRTKNKVVIKKHPGRNTPGQTQRRQDAQIQKKQEDNPLSVEHLELVLPLDVISYAQSGLAPGVNKRMKQGGYTIDAKLDLHHNTVEQARIAVMRFIVDCQKYDARLAIILHGKGERGDPPALLKSFTNKWLRKIPEVLAFHSATRQHGGVGAVYVLIKKSEKNKQLNREKYGHK